MSTPSFPFGDGTAPEPELFHELSTMTGDIERNVLDVEPKARELNRHLTSLLGRCPSSSDGSWVTIDNGEDGETEFRLARIDERSVLTVVARLGEISRILEDNEPEFLSGNRYQSDLGPVIVGEAATLLRVPSTHVRKAQ